MRNGKTILFRYNTIPHHHFYLKNHSPSLATAVKGESLFQYFVIVFHDKLVQGTSSRAYKYAFYSSIKVHPWKQEKWATKKVMLCWVLWSLVVFDSNYGPTRNNFWPVFVAYCESYVQDIKIVVLEIRVLCCF